MYTVDALVRIEQVSLHCHWIVSDLLTTNKWGDKKG